MALALLALAWLINPSSRTAPLYDGLGFPDEAYRFVAPPAGYRTTPAPTAATLTVKLAGKKGSIFDIISAEVGPQVELYVNRSIIAAPDTATVTVRATPAPSPSLPVDGAVWGNVYRVSVQAAGRSVPLQLDRTSNSIRLRTPAAPPPAATMAYYDGTSWRRLPTQRIGNDIWAAPLMGTGFYAALAPAAELHYEGLAAAGGTRSHFTGGRLGVLAWIVGAAVAVLAALSYAVRRVRG